MHSRECEVQLTSVGHTESSDFVRDLLVGLSDFIGDATVVGAGDGLSGATLEGGSRSGASGSGAGTVGVLGVGATKLVHKVGNLQSKKKRCNEMSHVTCIEFDFK